MARRRIGQEQLAIVGNQHRNDTLLDEVSQLVDWTETNQLPSGVSAAVRGLGSPGAVPGAAAGDMARPLGCAPGRASSWFPESKACGALWPPH